MWSGIWSDLELASELESDLWEIVDWGRKWLQKISMLEKPKCFCLTGLIKLVLLMTKWMGLFFRKNHLLRCWGWLSWLNWGCVASLSLFYRYYFGRCSPELAQLDPLLYSWVRSSHFSDRLHDFTVTNPRCYKDVYVNSFFPHTGRLWNSLPAECFPLTYALSGFESRINRYLLTVGSF